MGVLSSKDVFNSKYVTAVIIDSSNRSFFVPIKYTLGDYFLTVIERRLYVFRMNEQILTYRHTLVKSFRWYLFTTGHYLPLSPNKMKELEMILEKNDLPRINMMLFNILKYLGRREKHEFQAHKISKLVEELASHEDRYSEQIQNLLNYLDHLSIDEVVTPVKKMTEFIEDDLIQTDPKFFGDVINFFKRTDTELKHVNNQPITGKTPWLKIIAITMGIGLVAAVAYFVWQGGYFNNILPDLSQIKPLDLSGAMPKAPGIMERYPDPLDLKLAIDRGEVDYSTLPQNVKSMVDNVKLPAVVPKSQTIEITP